MHKVALTAYRTLLRSSVRADLDFARRALITALPTQAYDFRSGEWVDIDVAKELQENERALHNMVRELNHGREWFVPPLADAGSNGIVRDMAVSNAVKTAFRRDPPTAQNLSLAFAAVRVLSAVDVGSRSIPPAPLFPPCDYGFRVAAKGLAEVGGPLTAASDVGLLVAHPMMTGFFRHAIIMLAEANDDGALGIVVNKPLLNEHGQGVPVWAVVPDDLHPLFSRHLKDNPVMIGGPVRGVDEREAGSGLFVVHTIADVPDSTPVGGGVFFTGNIDAIHAVFEAGRAKPADVMVVLGYAGWGAGQLAGEVERGSWFVATGRNREALFQLNAFVDSDSAEAPPADPEDSASAPPISRHPQESWVRLFGGLNPACAEMSRLGNFGGGSGGLRGDQ